MTLSQVSPTSATPTTDAAVDPLVARRRLFQDRHAQRLTLLMASRDDLRGVHALADSLDDMVRWSA